MSVNSIKIEESLDFVRNLTWLVSRAIVIRRSFSVFAPVMHESLKHPKGSQLIELPQSSKCRESEVV